MPNLQQLLNLRNRYGNIPGSELKKEDMQLLFESFDPEKIEKGFKNLELTLATKNFSFPRAKGFVQYFLERKRTNVVLLFIDITGFSHKFSNKTADQLADYLDDYYSMVIPLISIYGGEIEKIMGDGIICVFGEPFLQENMDTLHEYAEACSRKIISSLFDTDYSVKIALHYGEIMYYQNTCDSYYEYTMIGNAITELFRLESIAKPNSITFFSDTQIHKIQNFNIYKTEKRNVRDQVSNPPQWILRNGGGCNLQGVGNYSSFRYIEYSG